MFALNTTIYYKDDFNSLGNCVANNIEDMLEQWWENRIIYPFVVNESAYMWAKRFGHSTDWIDSKLKDYPEILVKDDLNWIMLEWIKESKACHDKFISKGCKCIEHFEGHDYMWPESLYINKTCGHRCGFVGDEFDYASFEKRCKLIETYRYFK